MGCASCAAKAATLYNPQMSIPPTVIEPCSYTVNVLTVLKSKLDCIKANAYYTQHNTTEQVVNSYLGFIISGISNPEYICNYKTQYDEMSSLIILIVNTQLC